MKCNVFLFCLHVIFLGQEGSTLALINGLYHVGCDIDLDYNGVCSRYGQDMGSQWGRILQLNASCFQIDMQVGTNVGVKLIFLTRLGLTIISYHILLQRIFGYACSLADSCSCGWTDIWLLSMSIIALSSICVSRAFWIHCIIKALLLFNV